jgi:site-specific DNA recombinase
MRWRPRSSTGRIATELNKEGIRAPGGGEWGFSTINGNAKRGNGILNNEMYIGRMVWNRQSSKTQIPANVRHGPTQNPGIVQEVPDLRILDEALWNAAKSRQAAIKIKRGDNGGEGDNHFRERRRFSGLTKCACCGGGYSMISADLIGCSTARNKGTCGNRTNIRRDRLEERVLNALRYHLMDPALFKEFCDEFTREMNRLRMEGRASIDSARSELGRIEKRIDATVDAIADGMYHPSMKEKMDGLEARKKELGTFLANAEEPPPLLHPEMANFYRLQVAELYDALQEEAEAKRLKAVSEGDHPDAGKRRVADRRSRRSFWNPCGFA